MDVAFLQYRNRCAQPEEVWNAFVSPEGTRQTFFGSIGGNAFTAEVRTNQELDEAIHQAEQQQSDKLCLIEMVVDDPMDAPEYLRKTRELLLQQKQTQ